MTGLASSATRTESTTFSSIFLISGFIVSALTTTALLAAPEEEMGNWVPKLLPPLPLFSASIDGDDLALYENPAPTMLTDAIVKIPVSHFRFWWRGWVGGDLYQGETCGGHAPSDALKSNGWCSATFVEEETTLPNGLFGALDRDWIDGSFWGLWAGTELAVHVLNKFSAAGFLKFYGLLKRHNDPTPTPTQPMAQRISDIKYCMRVWDK